MGLKMTYNEELSVLECISHHYKSIFKNNVTQYNLYKFFQSPHTMYDWSQLKNKIIASHSEKNFQKLDVYVKHHKSENTLFSTIFLNYVTRYNLYKFFQSPHTMHDWSQVKNNISASLSKKNF